MSTLKLLNVFLVKSKLEFDSKVWFFKYIVLINTKSTCFNLNIWLSNSACMIPCKVKRNISDLLFLYDLLSNSNAEKI